VHREVVEHERVARVHGRDDPALRRKPLLDPGLIAAGIGCRSGGSLRMTVCDPPMTSSDGAMVPTLVNGSQTLTQGS